MHYYQGSHRHKSTHIYLTALAKQHTLEGIPINSRIKYEGLILNRIFFMNFQNNAKIGFFLRDAFFHFCLSLEHCHFKSTSVTVLRTCLIALPYIKSINKVILCFCDYKHTCSKNPKMTKSALWPFWAQNRQKTDNFGARYLKNYSRYNHEILHEL